MTTWVIFTDLDETLIDRDEYGFAPAKPALAEARRRGIAIVPCTTKTAAETRYLMQRIGIDSPMIVEAGGAIYIPHGTFPGHVPDADPRGLYDVVTLAVGHEAVHKGLTRIKEFTGNSVRAFADMSPEEVARETGMPVGIARLAKLREYDEPFRFERDEEEFAPHLARIAREAGLRISRGGRYYHLHGETDKGRAVELLKSLYRKMLGEIRTIGIGDSEVDLPLLAAVDVPIAVKRADGTHDPALAALPGVWLTQEPGPAGWNEGILGTLEIEPVSE